jgi:hypothetical protein
MVNAIEIPLMFIKSDKQASTAPVSQRASDVALLSKSKSSCVHWQR